MRPHRIYVVCSLAYGARTRGYEQNTQGVHLIAWVHEHDDAERMRLKLEEQRGRYVERWGPPHVGPTRMPTSSLSTDARERDEFLAEMLDVKFLEKHRAFNSVDYVTCPVLDDPTEPCRCGKWGDTVAQLPVNPECLYHGGDPHEQARRDRTRSGDRRHLEWVTQGDARARDHERPLEVGEEVRLVSDGAVRAVRRRMSGVLLGVVAGIPNPERPLVDVRLPSGMVVVYVDGHRLPSRCAACRGEGRIDASVEGDRGRDCYVCDGLGRLQLPRSECRTCENRPNMFPPGECCPECGGVGRDVGGDSK